MTRLYPIAAIAVLGVLCAACAGGQGAAPEGGAESRTAQTVTYKCEKCGKTVTAAADAPAPSC